MDSIEILFFEDNKKFALQMFIHLETDLSLSPLLPPEFIIRLCTGGGDMTHCQLIAKNT